MEPTPRTNEEADRVEIVYQTVLAQIGASTTAEVLALWQKIPAGHAATAAASLLETAITQILTKRGKAKELGIAYYRLVRALRTGSTIANPINERPEPEFVSLERLRQEFEALIAEHTGEGTTEITAPVEPDGDDDSIEVEEIAGLTEALEADEDRARPFATEKINTLAGYSTEVITNLSEIKANADLREQARALHVKHGAMAAAEAAKITMNGGRNATNQASARDSRVIGWVRQSKTGTPCYWCAMLISRQVLYKSEFSAGAGARDDGRVFLGDGLFKYHNNCQCIALPVYSDSDFKTNPKYQENRYYWSLWERHIRGKYSGDLAISKWRELIRNLRTNESTTAAPEAA